MRNEIFDVEKWRQEQREKNVNDFLGALYFLMVVFALIFFSLTI